jgi:hypothetical protein
MTNERDEQGRDRATGGVFGGTPEEQRQGTPTGGRGVYPGTPDEKGGIRGEGQSDGPPGGDYGPLGWADVPGWPRPQVDEDSEDR